MCGTLLHCALFFSFQKRLVFNSLILSLDWSIGFSFYTFWEDWSVEQGSLKTRNEIMLKGMTFSFRPKRKGCQKRRNHNSG